MTKIVLLSSFLHYLMVFENVVSSKFQYQPNETAKNHQLISSTSIAISLPQNVTTPINNTSTSSWLKEALLDIAYYLRSHKFNEYDRRYELRPKLARREYYKGFPRPPLRSLHWEVHKYCEASFLECVDYLKTKIMKASLKRTDDTTVVIQQQQWNFQNNSKQIEIVDEECKKMKDLDGVLANPFEGPIERFQWRTTASYFMCWYTMISESSLKHLLDKCDNFASCLDPNLGPSNQDVRADDTASFSCALYSFCPDPCCPIKHLTKLENCWDNTDNPCFTANPAGQRQCVMNRSLNIDFRDLILNRWNVSCSCPREGFEWNSLYGMCIDVDECAIGSHNCDLKSEVCVNLPGNFKCACKWGHTLNKETRKCSSSDALSRFILQSEENEEHTKNETTWMKFVQIFITSSSTKWLNYNGCTPIIFIFLKLIIETIHF